MSTHRNCPHCGTHEPIIVSVIGHGINTARALAVMGHLVVTFNGELFIVGVDVGGASLEAKDLGQTLIELEPEVRRLVMPDFGEPMECDTYAPPRTEPTFTPNHRKHNKRGKFKRTGK